MIGAAPPADRPPAGHCVLAMLNPRQPALPPDGLRYANPGLDQLQHLSSALPLGHQLIPLLGPKLEMDIVRSHRRLTR